MTCDLDLENWTKYHELSGFEHLYLEDSYVLAIIQVEDSIEFQMEFVLLETHPLFCNPKTNEQYCYKKGSLRFENIIDVEDFSRTNARNVDVTGEVDFGNIDTFVNLENRYVLIGEWGNLDIVAASPLVTYI